jgi:hypothetical protein
MAFDLDPNYKQVPERIKDFKEKHPEGRLRPMDTARPYWLEVIEGQAFIVYAAAAYRDADDQLPGIGLAWECFPGKTPYTKGSELQNAETSAWGRAIVAALASESKSVASAEDVRNRAADQRADPLADMKADLYDRFTALDKDAQKSYRQIEKIKEWPWIAQMSQEQIVEANKWLDEQETEPF